MRELLRSTGTLQPFSTSLSKPIGPLPDLRKAIHSILPDWQDNDLSLRASEASDAPPVITMAAWGSDGLCFCEHPACRVPRNR